MSDFSASWSLSRKRFLDEIAGLDGEQLNWRIYPGCLTIGEMALHVAGVEASFASQLCGISLEPGLDRIKLAATEGVVNDSPFPFASSEIDAAFVASALESTRALLEPIISAADEASRSQQIKSALGPIITGEGAFARLGFHAAYHQGQAYLLKNSPDFPR
ncbi:MAG TPA: DinB family protein [Fimbriimonadaceae bacterium]|nr:DinB family protein [Fimbriimonadaceae bacterium]